jgi:hypothetical protein
MTVEFFDRQDKSSPFNGTKIATGAELSKVIDDLRSRSPFFCELLGANGYKLLLGVGKDGGCIQYSASDGSPPYLMVTTASETAEDDYFEFLIGNVPTPVPRRYCVSFDLMKKIAISFVQTGLRDSSVCWEEIGPPPSS